MKKPLHSTGCALGLATNYGRRILVCAKPSLFWSSWRPRSQRRVCRYRLSIGSWCASKAATPLEKPACPARWWIRYTPRSGLELEPGGAARQRLELSRRDLEPLVLDQLLQPIDDREVPVPVDAPDISRVQPPGGVERGRRGLRVVQVSRHYLRAADQELPVLVRPEVGAG